MSRSLVLIVAIVTILLTSDWTAQGERNIARLMGQTPLLFGRRGMNPNMNSLFFGKRADGQSSYIDQEICNLCQKVQPSCDLCVKESLLELADTKKK